MLERLDYQYRKKHALPPLLYKVTQDFGTFLIPARPRAYM